MSGAEGAMYESYGIKVDAKGNYAFGPKHEAASRLGAAMRRHSICSEMDGKDRVYSTAVTYRYGTLYKRQTIPGAVN